MSANASSSFELLHPIVQEFIWSQGWTELRDVQEQAIGPVLAADKDVVIAAETAAGKTEAAFLPALSSLLSARPDGLIVYVSPLKALINDQFGRLALLCEKAGLPVWPWHGDISSSVKSRFMAKPRGVLLITPEALEAMLCAKGTSIKSTFGNAQFVVIDELHSFIGSERGKQLQSVLHRIERVLKREVPRIGLSATLGDMQLAARHLRPGSQRVALVQAQGEGGSLKLLIKGYEEPLPGLGNIDPQTGEATPPEPVAPGHIAEHIFKATAGTNNLVFPNSRQQVENYTQLLNKLCEAQGRPVEYWPHHGSLSKELRSDTEQALKAIDRSANAVCTNTLELGIDIGPIRSVAQIGSPCSVSSLRQRLGRSGRRAGEPKVLRGYVIENAQAGTKGLDDVLRLDTLQLTAMVRLLLQGWFEPPPAGQLHYSTLVQQLLALIAERSGVSAALAYVTLCGPSTPFENVSKESFALLLRTLGARDLLVQDSAGALLHGKAGERFVNHFSFYAAFKADEEYRLVTAGKTLGALPVSNALKPGQKFLFAGKAWRVENIDVENKAIHVSRAAGGAAPLYTSGKGRVHGRVREEMRLLLESPERCPMLDVQAQHFLTQARTAYRQLSMHGEALLPYDGSLYVLTWLSDAANATLAAVLELRGFSAQPHTLGAQVSLGELEVSDVADAIRKVAMSGLPTMPELLQDAMNLEQEKWDWALPRELLIDSYASSNLAPAELHEWMKKACAEGLLA